MDCLGKLACRASRLFASCLNSRQRPGSIAISTLSPVPVSQPKHIAVAISGGVDSAVAAYLLKQQGHTVSGIFMQNWDEAEEVGNANCSVQQDLADAQTVCHKLGIPLHTANFVREYWTNVFEPFISQCERGLTPNPDLLCNRVIKFDLLIQHAKRLGADHLATGHYAQTRQSKDGTIQLLRPKDKEKDQTYFLASVPGAALVNTMFPLGSLLKSEVRDIAASTGLHNALRRSSAGICFIGRRKFGNFLAEYSKEMPGVFVDVDSKKMLGACTNMARLTYGQRAGPGGASDRMFVVGKDMQNKVVYLALGSEHPALYTKSAILRTPHWIAGHPPNQLYETGTMPVTYKARLLRLNPKSPDNPWEPSCGYRQSACSAIISPHDSCEPVVQSKYTTLLPEDGNCPSPNALQVQFQEPARAITPQQEFVMYDGDVCLGSAPVFHSGPVLFEFEQACHQSAGLQADLLAGQACSDEHLTSYVC